MLYQEHVHPWMAENEAAIDDFIASAHDRLKAAGISYLKRAIEMLRTNVLGMQPSEEPAAAASEAQQTPQGYTASLLARFSLPAARWTAATAGAAGADFYNLLAGAVAAATSSAAGTSTSGGASGTAATSADAAKDLSASGTLIPPSIRGTAERASFVAAQRERLAILLSALDREARQLDASRQQEAQESKQRQASAGEGRPRKGSVALDGATDAASSETSSLPRTRGSEVDFEKIDAESGAEEETGDGVRRRVPVSRSVSNAGDKAGGGGGASWLPWGWRSGGGGGGPEPSGTSSAIERDK